jgi:hypothetical protein
MSKLLTYFFFFQCLSLGFSQQATPSNKTVPEPIWIDEYDIMRPFEDFYDEMNPVKEEYAVVHKPYKGNGYWGRVSCKSNAHPNTRSWICRVK